MTDTRETIEREMLEAIIKLTDEAYVMGAHEATWAVNKPTMKKQITEWLDRQEVITERAWNTRAERTCELIDFTEHVIMDEPDIVELSCGHDCMVFGEENIPNYCPNCGAKVVEQ